MYNIYCVKLIKPVWHIEIRFLIQNSEMGYAAMLFVYTTSRSGKWYDKPIKQDI